LTEMNVQPTILHEEIETRYLSYALSTIVSRALPDVRDGLKPVHRRILFAMHSIGAAAAARFVKSARVVGEVIGKYHPHGDVAVYDAMVRMAQDFALRYPVVEGQGNFGSVDGDNAAAMRYTESRTSAIAEEFFHDLKLDTVAFRSNYDATLQEPAVLPVRFPNLLVNGSSGIAVGMSTSFPPHNMTEVCDALLACIEQQDIKTQQLMEIIKAPDFPTGGEILNDFNELVEIYRQGRGTIRVRGQYLVEVQKRGRLHLVLTSIPYSVNKARLIERIAQFIQARKLPLVHNIWDESTEEVRIVLELKPGPNDQAKAPEKVMAFLYKYTPMEINFPLNFTCLTPEGVPERMSIKELLLHFLDFRKEVITRRLAFERQQIRERLHLLQGFLAIFDALDEAIALIRGADQRSAAKKALMENFQLDALQADAILELRLQALVRLEEARLRQEMAERSQRLGAIEEILGSDRLIWQEVRQELQGIKQRYGDARRTLIAAETSDLQFTSEDFVEHEDIWIVLTQQGRLKRLKNFDPDTLLLREDDRIRCAFVANTRDRVAFFSNLGRVYVVTAFDLPASGKGYGEPIQTIFAFQDGEQAVAGLALSREVAAGKREIIEPTAVGELPDGRPLDAVNPPKSPLPAQIGGRQLGLFAVGEGSAGEASATAGVPRTPVTLEPSLVLLTRAGKGLRLPCANLNETTIRAGRQVMKLEPGDQLALVVAGDAPWLLLATAKRIVVVNREEIAQLTGPGKGVKLMTADPSGIRTAVPLQSGTQIWVASGAGSRKEYALDYFRTVHRGGKGRLIKGGIVELGPLVAGERKAPEGEG
jgi:DNA gyrase/topoisomerase IV subunit A